VTRYTRYLVAASVAVLAGQGACGSRVDDVPIAIDLVHQYQDAKKQPSAASFAVSDVTIEGQTKSSIVSRGSTRLTFHVTVPVRGRFRVFVASPPGPSAENAGSILFLVGISDGHTYRDVQSRELSPRTRPSDRHWLDVSVDLAEYENMTIDLILNVRVSDGGPELAAWGSPAVVTR
jgi:hypothetical protein